MKIILLLLIFLNIIFAQTTSDEKIVKINGSKFKKLDIDKDFKSMQKGCNSGVTPLCKNIAFAYAKGTKTIKKDFTKYAFYVNKTCEQNDYKACQLLGDLYLRGYEDIKKDQNKSYKFFKLSCENANLAKSCFWVAQFEILGLKGAPKNPFKSEKTLTRLCKKNHKDSCTILKNFYKAIDKKTDQRYLEEKAIFEQKQQSKEYTFDPQTNLMWQDDSDTNTIKRNFKGAKKYCEELETGGYDDWRLPNASELFSLVDKTNENYTNLIIKYTNEYIYWSQTTSSKDNKTMWGVWFERSWFPSHVGLEGELYVRCVKGKEYPLDTKRFYIAWEEQ